MEGGALYTRWSLTWTRFYETWHVGTNLYSTEEEGVLKSTAFQDTDYTGDQIK